MFALDDIAVGMATGNNSQRDIGVDNLVNSLGALKNALSVPGINLGSSGVTSYLNVTNLINQSW